MSNQYYNYIVDLLLSFFDESEINTGDRFYLQLDTSEEVEHFVTALKRNTDSTQFIYKHPGGEPYETFSIPINNLNLVVAYTSLTVTPDFLVTLRNQVGEQKGVWKNTALLSIVSEQLDSIEGGSSNLQKEGMPLHPKSLTKRLEADIDSSSLSKTEQYILQDARKRLLDDHYLKQVTLLDFMEIFNVLNKGKLEDEDYYRFGLFRDGELSTYIGDKSKLEQRLNTNKELFEFVQRVHNFGSLDGELEKKFTNKGVQQLKDENWQTVSFSDVSRYAAEKEDENKKAKVELKTIETTDKSLVLWNKPLSDTRAGQRKRQIIIFNPNHHEEVELRLDFEIVGSQVKNVSKDFFTSTKGIDVKFTSSTSRAKVLISAKEKEPTFVRIAYRHEDKTSLGAELHIAIIPCQEFVLQDIKTKYFVNVNRRCIELEADIESIKIGEGFTNESLDIYNAEEHIQIPVDTEVTLIPQQEAFDEDETLLIYVELEDCTIPLLLKNDLPESTPITGIRIWKMKREEAKDFQLKENRLVIGNHEFYTHKQYAEFFKWEKTWVKNGLQSATLTSGDLQSILLNLNAELQSAFERFVSYFKVRDSFPSLCYYSDELQALAEDYVIKYINQIKEFEEGIAAGSKGRDLMKLGVIFTENELYYTPFHPLVVAYQLTISKFLQKEEVDYSILNRLKPNYLIPFLYNEHEMLYKPDSQSDALEWIRFKPVREVTVSDANQYLAKVVHEKINQFSKHFKYLFNSKAPIRINVINISNDLEVLKGIVNWLLQEIENKGPENMIPIEISLYNSSGFHSSFDDFSRLGKVEEVTNLLETRFKSSKYDENDILRFIRENLFYFKQESNEVSEYRYAHISFYKMHGQENYAIQPMKEMITGLSLDGLVSSIPSMKGDENYRSGFGIRGYKLKDSLLVQTAYFVNELVANMKNYANDSYRKGESIVSRTNTDDEKTLSKIFDSSYWVTFIDPNVDLDFFQEYDRNLVIIHYNDQFTSSSRYDAITVTDKSYQFNAVISEMLKNKNVEVSENNVKNTIKAFNTFNGEWLLRIIGSKGHLEREKISIIAAIKYSLAYFDHPNILWVPISLEEILRVAGAVGLNKRDGLFTAKNLGSSGKHSDDLLLVGLEFGEKLKLHYYPIEVKIGINPASVIENAKKQVYNTQNLFDVYLMNQDDNNLEFKNKFYRNFFAQLLIANAKKIEQSGLWPEKSYRLDDDIISDLLSDQYDISKDLRPYIGSGCVMLFNKDGIFKSAILEDEVLVINLNEYVGYQGVIESVEELKNKIKSGLTDFEKEKLIAFNYSESLKPNLETKEKEIVHDVYVSATDSHKWSVAETDRKSIESMRILIGKAVNSNRKIYWEYGHPELANRHLLITGKSGQGKTYLMQCLIVEKAKLGLSSIVIDYTEGFVPNQIEKEFNDYLGTNLMQSIVVIDKLKINPFQRNIRDIGGIHLPETEADIAERIKSVIGSVYRTLGIQQLNAIYEATLNGLIKHGSQMDLQKLKEELELENSTTAKTALSQIRPLIDRNPFTNESEMDWGDIVNSSGKVFVIQLTQIPREVQLMITEFILWDLWNYSVRNGSKDIPMSVIMDEAQNLDHTEKSPSARILTEGRKFGWSGWYATQFLKSQLGNDELARLQNSSQKIYFSPPEQEIPYLASTLSQDSGERKEWEKKLSSLKKGQCIVHGPHLDKYGHLTQSTPVVVDIIPLDERLK